MNRLSQHICYLLRLHDCVVLPGAGAFCAEYKPAWYDEERDIFHSPFKALSFNPSIIEDDSLLLNSYMRKMVLSPSKARQLLEEDIAAFLASLQIDGYAEFPGLGRIRQNADGSVELLPSYIFGKAINRLGMRNVSLNRKKAPFLSKEKKATPQPEAQEAFQNVIVKNPDYYYIPVHKKLAAVAASFLLVLIVGAFALLPIDWSDKAARTASILPVTAKSETLAKPQVPKATPKAVAPKAKIDSAQLTAAAPQVKSEAPATPPAQATPPVASANDYHIVVAAFRSAEEAASHIASYPGSSNFNVIPSGKYFYVIAASADSNDALREQLASVRQIHPKAWVWHQN